jgi:hypothetical protein
VSLRWQDYVLAYDEDVVNHWRQACPGARPATFVLGAGFDPRALVGLASFLNLPEPDRLTIVVLELPEGPHRGEAHELAKINREALESLKGGSTATFRHVAFPDVADRLHAGLAVSRQLHKDGLISNDGLVVIDISALPSSLFFPIIGSVLAQADGGPFIGDLQVLVCENPEIDRLILDEGSADPGPIAGFNKGLTQEAGSAAIKVWVPILGEGQGPALDALFGYLTPDEICPVLPFPARNPRRADDLVMEHRDLLLGRMEVEPGNFIYAHETNPFDVYRRLADLSDRYRKALAPIGEAMVVVSVHASKMLSIGVLLAAWECNLPVVSVSPSGYVIESASALLAKSELNRLASAWLLGEPYR